MPHVRWAGTSPPSAPPLPRVTWLVARDTRGTRAILTGRALLGAFTHWEAASREWPKGRRVPCLAGDCGHCGRGRLATRYWWVSCRPWRSTARAILELSEGAAVQLAALAPDPHSLRGLGVEVRRADGRQRAPQVVSLIDLAPFQPLAVPDPFDVQPWLEQHWQLAGDALSSALPDWTPDGRPARPQVRRAQP